MSDDPRNDTIRLPDVPHSEFPWRPKRVEFDANAPKLLQLVGALAEAAESLPPSQRERLLNACRDMARTLQLRELRLF